MKLRLTIRDAVLFLLFTCCAVTAYSLNPDIQISQYSHMAWRLEDGVLPSLPQAIQQTNDGYIWIGTLDGLLRFDGIRFVRWQPLAGQALLSEQVTALQADPDGSLWIGTREGLSHLVHGNLTTYTEHKGTVEQLLIDHSGSVWFTRAHIRHEDVAGPLCRVQSTHINCFGARDGIPFRYAQSLAEDKAGFLWIGTDTAVTRWKPGSATTFSPSALQAAAGQHGVEALWSGKDGSMWVGITRVGPQLGLQHVTGDKWKPITLAGFDSSKLKVWALYEDAEDSLWIGTTDQGLYRVHDGKVSHFGASDGLSSDSPSTIFEDREGNLWIITSEGLDRFRALPVNSFSMRQGLTAPLARSVFAAKDGAVWVANNGAINIILHGVVSSLGSREGLPGEIVQCVFQDHLGRFWAGVDDKLVIYDKDHFRTVNLPTGKPLGTVVDITEATDGDLWVVSDTGQRRTLYRIHGDGVAEQMLSPGVPAAFSVGRGLGGSVWLGLINGDLASDNQGTVTVYPEPHAPDGTYNPLRNVALEEDGSVLGTNEQGLVEWRDGNSQQLTVRNGLPCAYIGSFVKDLQQDLYMNMSCGIVSISHAELQRWWGVPATQIQYKLYDAKDGARFVRVQNSLSATRSLDGRLWFANVTDLQMLDPNNLPFNRRPPAVMIESIANDGKTIPVRDGFELPPHQHSLQFDYTALSFVMPHKLLFRYRLEGHDANWQAAGTRRQALYNDLPPGRYKFDVIACNEDGVWNNEGASIRFVIVPAIYQRTWFKAVAIGLALLALWSLYLLRMSIATERVRSRLSERMVERERIARELHDTLLQGVQGLLLLFQHVMTRMPGDDPNRATLGHALDRADDVLLDARHRVRDLRFEAETTESLAVALTKVAAQLQQSSAVQFQLLSVPEPRMLNPAVREEACRIGREALFNAYQHAGASSITVELVYERNQFRMLIRDDGKGIPPAVLENGRGGHWGLSGMRERAKSIGGNLKIRSPKNAGTSIELHVPAKLAYVAATKTRD
jgi:signal transduction histidine kinase/ligand-binding sensor domain-containing protein